MDTLLINFKFVLTLMFAVSISVNVAKTEGTNPEGEGTTELNNPKVEVTPEQKNSDGETQEQSYPEGLPEHGYPEGSPEHGYPEGSPEHGDPEGSPEHGSPEGFPEHGYPEGSPEHGYPEGSPEHGSPEGFPEQGYPEGFPEYGSPEGFPEQGYPEGYPEYGSPEGFPEYGHPEGYPEYGSPEGFPEYGYPEGYPEYGSPEGFPVHGYPGGSPEHGYPEDIPEHGYPEKETPEHGSYPETGNSPEPNGEGGHEETKDKDNVDGDSKKIKEVKDETDSRFVNDLLEVLMIVIAAVFAALLTVFICLIWKTKSRRGKMELEKPPNVTVATIPWSFKQKEDQFQSTYLEKKNLTDIYFDLLVE